MTGDYRAQRPVRRNHLGPAIAGLVLGTLILGGSMLHAFSREPADASRSGFQPIVDIVRTAPSTVGQGGR